MALCPWLLSSVTLFAIARLATSSFLVITPTSPATPTSSSLYPFKSSVVTFFACQGRRPPLVESLDSSRFSLRSYLHSPQLIVGEERGGCNDVSTPNSRLCIFKRIRIRRRRASVFEMSSSSSTPTASSDGGDACSDIPLPSKDELQAVLRVAVNASQKAGDIIMGHGGGAEVTERKANSRDLLTVVDPLCEKVIRDTVHETYPTHDFLGEEDVPPGKEASAAAIDAKLQSSSSSDWLWIVDPIDGTTNFVHGMPLCMPSVAVAYKGEVVVGVIYDPHRNEMFTAIKGQGAYLNGDTKITVGEQDLVGDAVVAMGSPPGAESLQMSLRGINALMPKVRTIRMLGSAAIMLAWVACGRLTCYWEYDLSSWDIAAGALLITEAGGRFTDLNGEPYNLRVRKMIASNGKVHDGILNILNEANVV